MFISARTPGRPVSRGSFVGRAKFSVRISFLTLSGDVSLFGFPHPRGVIGRRNLDLPPSNGHNFFMNTRLNFFELV